MTNFKSLTRFSFTSAVLAVATLSGCMLFKTDKSLFPDTSYKPVKDDEIELTQEVTPITGMTLPAGTVVDFENGRIHDVKPKVDIQIFGKTMPAGSDLVFQAIGSQLSMAYVILGRAMRYDNLEFKQGDEIALDDKGSMVWAKISSDRAYAGKHYEDESELTIKNGKITRARTQTQIEAANEAEAAESRRTYDNCMNACAPLGSGPDYATCTSRCHY